MKKVVVIGAGQAGASLVIKLRDIGHDGSITLIGSEPHPPYQRPPISKKYLLGECCAIHLGLFPLLEKSLSDVFSSLDCPDHEANEKILLALQETNNQLL